MVALPCWPFELPPLNGLYRVKLVRSIPLIPFKIGIHIYHISVKIVASPCCPFEFSPLNDFYWEKACALNISFVLRDLLTTMSAQPRYSTDRPVCYGKSRLKNRVCVVTRYALLKTSNKHLTPINNTSMEISRHRIYIYQVMTMCVRMVASPCYHFELSPLNEL